MCSRKGNGVCHSFLFRDLFLLHNLAGIWDMEERRQELTNRNKPWSHTTTFEKPDWRQEGKGSQFGDTARGNEVMKAYD